MKEQQNSLLPLQTSAAANEWADCPDYLSPERMESSQKAYCWCCGDGEYLATDLWREAIYLGLLRQIDRLQGMTGLQCILSSGYLNWVYFAAWAYKLAREYVERYQPQYGSGLIPESVPMLLEVAEFWCQHFLSNSGEKFPSSYPQSSFGTLVMLYVCWSTSGNFNWIEFRYHQWILFASDYAGTFDYLTMLSSATGAERLSRWGTKNMEQVKESGRTYGGIVAFILTRMVKYGSILDCESATENETNQFFNFLFPFTNISVCAGWRVAISSVLLSANQIKVALEGRGFKPFLW